MRIVQIANTLQTSDGGPARYAAELSKALDTEQNHIKLLHFTPRAARSLVTDDKRVAKEVNLGSLKSIREVINLLRFADLLVLHGYYLAWTPFVLFLTPPTASVVVIPHGSLTSFQSTKHHLRKLCWNVTLGKYVRSRVRCFLVASPREGADLQRQFPSVKWKVVGMGLDLESQVPLATPRDPSKAVGLLSLSRIAPKKRVDLSIHALYWLKRPFQNVILSVVGSGDERLVDRLHLLCRQLGVEESVTFKGEKSGKAKWEELRGADIFLLPSEDENFGVTVAEAASMGIPVITTYNVDSATLLDGDGIFRLREWTEASVIEAVSKALEFRSDGDRMAELRKRVIANTSWSEVASRIVNLAR